MKKTSIILLSALLSMQTMAQTPATQNKPAEKVPEKAKDINLNEVVIQSKKPLIVQEIDKTVVNVEAMISAAASNTLEVLEKTPGVSINSNGEISLNGRSGVLVLIDGKNTYMSGQDLAAYLKSLPGGNLDKIELIDNPSAKYDASGNAIINIKLKKNRIGGFTGNISAGVSLGRYARNNDAVNLNYNYKKLNLFANLGYNYERNYRKDHFDRRFFDEGGRLISTVDLQNNLVYNDRSLNANFGMDYSATSKTVYGLIFNVNKGERNGMFDYESSDFNANHQLERTGKGDTKAKDSRTNLGFNFNLQHKFDNKGKELSADINYLNYQSKGNQALQNFTYAPEGALLGHEKFRYVIPAGIDIYTAKADYVHPLKNKARFEAGFKSSIVDNDNLNKFYNVNGAEQTIDNSKSNHFKYHENINAVYLNGQKSWKRLGVQFGLRTENTLVRGKQLGNDAVQGSAFTKNYTGLFPSAYISYKLDSLGNNTLGLMAVRRISRPNYQLLNPFLFYRDQYSYTSGNPLLNPQYQSRIELKYQHKQFLNMGLSYNKFSNLIFQTTEAVNDIFTTRPKNIAGGFMLLLNTTVSTSPAEWWYLNYTARLSKIGMNGRVYTENLHFNVNILRLEVNNYFTISPTWSAELGGYYASRDMNGQTLTKGMYRVNGGIQKKILKRKGSMRVAFDDLFHSWIYNNQSLSLKQSEYFQTSESDTQRISFAMTYRFGKDTFARKRRHNNNASDEEKGRID
ncbi:outer membrane beta-barrel protein [Dyadobacter chenwenxiniae]|uniref:Outer membrane beta-barrel protein n=1 Tax=Dyadobacter chenwenxiniae TaxID=2906456 RepID=A0A9X1PP25_9BACT|nr:outer membrane beta-barrel family protein [Dyadobacter chenwenxiniae]MCF0064448.1 outer membrane beta-barrel protein [Dyadobacter chenwenxiniae]UON82349.1 outer membrane beta-barrel protein [Dyadobacter chenwenxiniae]